MTESVILHLRSSLIVNDVYISFENEVIRKPKKNLDATLADKYIYYCKNCKHCWEKTKTRWSNCILYYDNFPSYKKTRKICKRCTPDKSVKLKDDT